jgi:hypothetical protein
MEKVETVSRLMELVRERRAVFCPSKPAFSRRIPAAFIVNMSFSIAARLMEAGLYVYEKKQEKKENERK